MGRFFEKWNKNRFSIYDSEEKSVLGLIKELGEFVNFVGDELENKTDLKGDHQGTWQGFKPTQVGEYLQTMVIELNEKIQNFNYKNVSEFGEIVTGDNTPVLQKAIDFCCKNNYILDLGFKSYFVTSLSIPSNLFIRNGVIKGVSNTNVLEVNGENIIIDTIFIDGLNLINNAINVTSSKNILITNCNIKNCKGKGINIVNSSNYMIQENILYNLEGQAIELSFSSEGKIIKNNIDKAYHGIQFWGGDSATERTRGIENVTISFNTVKNVTGGIWGSLGKNIIITENNVSICKDVGIDYEGCIDSLASNNNVKNCTNGGLAIFYGAENVSFTSNNVIQEIDSPCVKFFGSTYKIKNCNISNNTLQGKQGLYCDENSIYNIIISGNNFINETFNISLVKGCDSLISNNLFFCNGAKSIIIDGGMRNIINSNLFTSTYKENKLPSESSAIFISWANNDFNGSNNLITNNIINDYVNSITIDSWGWDSGAKSVIKDNHLNKINIKAPGVGFQGVCSGNTKIDNPTEIVNKTDFS